MSEPGSKRVAVIGDRIAGLDTGLEVRVCKAPVSDASLSQDSKRELRTHTPEPAETAKPAKTPKPAKTAEPPPKSPRRAKPTKAPNPAKTPRLAETPKPALKPAQTSKPTKTPKPTRAPRHGAHADRDGGTLLAGFRGGQRADSGAYGDAIANRAAVAYADIRS